MAKISTKKVKKEVSSSLLNKTSNQYNNLINKFTNNLDNSVSITNSHFNNLPISPSNSLWLTSKMWECQSHNQQDLKNKDQIHHPSIPKLQPILVMVNKWMWIWHKTDNLKTYKLELRTNKTLINLDNSNNKLDLTFNNNNLLIINRITNSLRKWEIKDLETIGRACLIQVRLDKKKRNK